MRSVGNPGLAGKSQEELRAPLWPNYRFRSRASFLGGRPAPVVRRSQVPNYEGDAIMLASDTRCRAGGMWIYCCDLLRARNSGAPGYLL